MSPTRVGMESGTVVKQECRHIIPHFHLCLSFSCFFLQCDTESDQDDKVSPPFTVTSFVLGFPQTDFLWASAIFKYQTFFKAENVM